MKIPSFPQYDITEDGIVTSIRTGKVIKAHNSKGRYIVTLVGKDYKYHTTSVLYLLAETFIGPRPSKYHVATVKDGNKLNVTVDNVTWRKRSEVNREAYNSGQRRRPTRSYDESSIALVLNALEQYDEPVCMTELSTVLQVPYATVRYSMLKLIETGRARKLERGYEVIR